MTQPEYCYKFPRPAIAVDIVCLRQLPHSTKIVLIKRAHEPFLDLWALPGGFIQPEEELKIAALRELKEETGLTPFFIEQFHCFDHPLRDPRERVISCAHLALLGNKQMGQAGDDAKELAWFSIDRLPPLGFDHEEIIIKAIQSYHDWQELGII